MKYLGIVGPPEARAAEKWDIMALARRLADTLRISRGRILTILLPFLPLFAPFSVFTLVNLYS